MQRLHRKYRSKSTSNVNIKTSLCKFFSQKKPTIVTNQPSFSARASDSITINPVTQQKPIQSLCTLNLLNAEVVSTILSFCDFQRILSLRLVSKIFHLTSTISTDRPSPLAKHAITFSPFFRLISCFEDDSNYKEKFTFALKQDLEHHIILSINDLHYSPSKLKCIPRNKLKIILEIDLHQEILQLQYLISKNIKNCINFINIINWIKFSQLNIKHCAPRFNLCHASHGPSINSLLTTISQNLDYFRNLTCLSIGDIGTNCTRQLPAFNTLKSLSIGTICPKATFEISGSLDELTSCYIEVIHPGTILKLPNLLPNLFKLHIETILSNTCIELPNAFSNLSILSIGTLANNVSFKLSNSFINLSHFTINEIEEGATIRLPDSLPNLSSFSIVGHIAVLTTNSQEQKSFTYAEPTNNSLFEDLLKYINERVNHHHT